jgi:hypothetical protein|tara:strand:- start:35 stop:169 length:135 start_codon:yes stop_codon:yes gene_type:complete
MKVKTQNKVLIALAVFYGIGFLVEVLAITYIAIFIYGLQNSLLQ